MIHFFKTYINQYGREAHKPGSIYNCESGTYLYVFDKVPRKLKKQVIKFTKQHPTNKKIVWLFNKPTQNQLIDPSFIWLECFRDMIFCYKK